MGSRETAGEGALHNNTEKTNTAKCEPGDFFFKLMLQSVLHSVTA